MFSNVNLLDFKCMTLRYVTLCRVRNNGWTSDMSDIFSTMSIRKGISLAYSLDNDC